jgi:VanZ family protein
VVFAAFVELIQLMIPGRHARLSDFAVDAVASCIGVALALFFGARALQQSA